MSRIFSMAHEVVIYLGEHDKGSRKIFEFFESRANEDEEDVFHRRNWSAWTPGMTAAIQGLLRRPWFTRVWILQEVYLARPASFICGSSSAPLLILVRFKDEGRQLWDRRPMQDDDWPFVISLIAPTEGHDQHENRDLLSVLRGTRQFCATDPRVKIFAVLSLTDIDERLLPDYSEITASTFTRAAEYILQEDATCLGLLLDVEGKSIIKDLPSWVSDWSIQRRTVALPFDSPFMGKWAGGPFEFSSICQSSGERHLHYLKIRGVQIDRITTLSATSNVSRTRVATLIKLWDAIARGRGAAHLFRCSRPKRHCIESFMKRFRHSCMWPI